MRNIIFYALLIMPVFLNAQSSFFEEGKVTVSVGLAGPNLTNATLDLLGYELSDKKSTPFIMGNITYGISKNIDAGFHVGYHQNTSNVGTIASIIGEITGQDIFNAKSTFNVTTLGAKITVHNLENSIGNAILNEISSNKNIDLYASTYLGYNIINRSVDIDTGLGSGINSLINSTVNSIDYPQYTYSVNAGILYAVTDNFAVYGELGYGRFLISGGVAYKL